MKLVHIAVLASGMAFAFAAGYLVTKPRSAPDPSAQEISQAQETANRLLPPVWIRMFRDKPWLTTLRQRGYQYCYRNGSIDGGCAHEQDEALQAVFFAIDISNAQQGMTDRSRLSLREREVASHPQLRHHIVQHCFRLYSEHGMNDARLLAACLGNLSDFSPLVPIPVP
jgi:hypothetical protein